MSLEEAAAAIDGARRLLLTCHQGPDGDSLGSMSALASLLRARGREVTLYNPDQAPRTLRWLPHVGTMIGKVAASERYDVTVVVDCGDRKLLGPSFPPPDVTGKVVVLDHHAASRPFGDLYVCQPEAASVGVLIARLARILGWPLDADAALAIFVSLVADTGSFRYANTNAEAFELASSLVGVHGVDPWFVAERLGEQVPLARHKLLAAALATITLELDGKVAVMTVSDEMVRAAGARWEHSEGLVNYARSIEGVECGVLLTPAREAGTRVSLRSKGRIDAGAVCAPLGGGGHRGAAGCVIAQPIPAAREIVLAALAAPLGITRRGIEPPA